MRVNKWLYGFALYANYGDGWEYEVFELTWKEMRERLKEYREAAPQFSYKSGRKREINPDWVTLHPEYAAA